MKTSTSIYSTNKIIMMVVMYEQSKAITIVAFVSDKIEHLHL